MHGSTWQREETRPVGPAFAAQPRRLSPTLLTGSEATRILLTGYADLDSAVSAINEGQLFRFLIKPCPPSELLAAREAAVAMSPPIL
jgi:response regulator RpfG family c-di-GMP phosphodiesterase